MGKILGDIVWWLFGGLETALSYFAEGIAFCATIIGIPFGLQLFKLALVMLIPFGSEVSEPKSGCLTSALDVLWFFIGGAWIVLEHLFFGVLLFITIIGIPFARKHFTLARVALRPFGRTVDIAL